MNRYRSIYLFIHFILLLSITGCNPKENPSSKFVIQINYDGKQEITEASAGTSIKNVLDSANIQFTSLDRIDPSPDTIINQNVIINITRVREAFIVQEQSIPFEPQTVFNETLPKGQHMNIQEGKNGSQNITYRVVYENDKEVTRSIVKTEVIIPSKPQIEMVGVQAPSTPVDFPGLIVYLSSGNAWKVEKSSGDRKPIITTGDLDGHIFNLSENRKWLLFTRKTTDPSSREINSLWFLDLSNENSKPVDLGINNIIHFAAWKPGADLTIGYSTVEPRSSAPGWQANNDLIIYSFDSDGKPLDENKILAPNSGGVYGWWGTNFAWSPDGKQIAFSRPDGIGLVDIENHEQKPLLSITPYQTSSNWAWIPGLSWSPDGNIIYFVNHNSSNDLGNKELSTIFDLNAIFTVPSDENQISIIPQAGIFAYPVVSSYLPGNHFIIAFMQSILPDQSNTSRYQLMTIDQDGSNKKKLFPPDGSQGLEPQATTWSPRTEEGGNTWMAFIYQGKLNLININTGEVHQIAGDNSVISVEWK